MAVVENPTNKPQGLQRRGTTASPLIVPARIGHRRILKEIFVQESTPGGRIDISVGNTTKVRLRCNLTQAILVQSLNAKQRMLGLLGVLAAMIPNFPFPTSTQDEDITITYTAVGGSVLTRIDAYFEDQESGDVITRTLPGGSLSTKDFMILNFDNNAALTAAGLYFFDNLDIPIGAAPFAEGVDIKVGARRMSPGQKFTVYAIAGDFVIPAATNKTDRVHIFDESIELFTSENNEGLYVDPEVANELSFDLDPSEYWQLPVPYEMLPNRLFTFQGNYVRPTTNAAANSQKLFLIGIREFVGGA